MKNCNNTNAISCEILRCNRVTLAGCVTVKLAEYDYIFRGSNLAGKNCELYAGIS